MDGCLDDWMDGWMDGWPNGELRCVWPDRSREKTLM